MVVKGQTVKATVTVKNTGTQSFTFGVGFTIRHVATSKDYDLPLQSLSLGVRNTGSKTFSWTVPSAAPTGFYSMIAAVWKKTANLTDADRLDDEVVPNAFSVS